MGRSIRVHNRACWLNSLNSPPLRTTIGFDAERSTAVNLSLLLAVVMLLAWIVLAFVVQTTSGAVHLLYATAVILFARRVLAGAPRFVS
jgi:hypothetical protein